MITHKQLTLAKIENCQNKVDNDKYSFLSLLDQTINLDEIVPASFVLHFHTAAGRPRRHRPPIVIDKKSDSPDEDKSLADSKALIPVLKDFFNKHPLINPKTFLGDTSFDTIDIYKSLFHELHFERAFIPLRNKLSLEDVDYTVNENGVPCCPHDDSLPMKQEGNKSHRTHDLHLFRKESSCISRCSPRF